jgi:hypothetical protein
MATFHAKSKVEFTIPIDQFGILYVIKKFLCVIFNFHPRIIHVSKDDAYNANNIVIRSIY